MPLPYPLAHPFGADNDHSRALRQLLPPGRVWRLEAESWIWKTLLAVSDEFRWVSSRAEDLVEETDPRTATETIEEWEEMLSLPDERVTEIPATLAERRIAITQKFVARGGQSPAYFIALALACGYVVTISNYTASLFRSGVGRSGDRLYGAFWAYSFLMTVDPPTGDVLPQADFERVIEHATHSHATVIFEYL
jgi:uncharacterized protein YmfQ (DUF2313 family)